MLTLAVWPGVSWAFHEHRDVEVGISEDYVLGAIVEQAVPQPLGPWNAFGLYGWLGSDPGFSALSQAEGSLLPLEEGCDIQLVVVELEPGLRMFDGGLNELFEKDTFHLGPPDFHRHAVWFIDANDASYDPNRESWRAAFRFVDQGVTGYGDSDVYELRFTTACKPGQTLSVRCKSGGKLVAKLKGGRPDAELTARLDGDENTDTEFDVDDRGRGKARFKGVADGPHQVDIVECGTTGNATCP